jgi:hypothetical protein
MKKTSKKLHMDTNKASDQTNQAIPPVEKPGNKLPSTQNQTTSSNFNNDNNDNEKNLENNLKEEKQTAPASPATNLPPKNEETASPPTENTANLPPQPPTTSPPSQTGTETSSNKPSEPEQKSKKKGKLNFLKNKKAAGLVIALFLFVGLGVFAASKTIFKQPEVYQIATCHPDNQDGGPLIDCSQKPDGWCTGETICKANPGWDWDKSCWCEVPGDGCCYRKDTNPPGESGDFQCTAGSQGISVKNNSSERKPTTIKWFARYCETNPGCYCSGGLISESVTLDPGETVTRGMTNQDYPQKYCDWAWQSDVEEPCQAAAHGCDSRPCTTPSPSPSSSPSPSPSPPSRPDICENATITPSNGELGPGETVQVSVTGSAPITRASYLVYNMGNLYGPNNPKPVCVPGGSTYPTDPCPDGYHHLEFSNEVNPANTTDSITLNYNDLFVTDYNTGWDPNQTLEDLQINVYIKDQATGNTSLAVPECVVHIHFKPEVQANKIKCDNLTFTSSRVKIGDELVFTCEGQKNPVDMPEPLVYNFRYSVDNGSWNPITASNTPGLSQPLEITQGGSYTVQCQVCAARMGGSPICTPWGSSNWINLN